MSKSLCQNCVAFVKTGRSNQGQCHLNPPTLIGLGTEKVQMGGRTGSRPLIVAAWPDVPPDGWCAQHAPTTPAFDVSQLRPVGEAAPINGSAR